MLNEEDPVVGGILLWLSARQVEAVQNNNRLVYATYQLLLQDLNTAAHKEMYPWELLMKGFKDRAEGKVKLTLVKDD